MRFPGATVICTLGMMYSAQSLQILTDAIREAIAQANEDMGADFAYFYQAEGAAKIPGATRRSPQQTATAVLRAMTIL